MKIFVGNLSFDANEDEIYSLFARFGPVASVRILVDRFTNRSRGFGFVEMAHDADAQAAIAALDGSPFNGQAIRVNSAHESPAQTPASRFSNQV